MAGKNVIAELLVAIGVDSKEAVKSADNIGKALNKAKKAADENTKATEKTEQAWQRLGKAGELAGSFAAGLTKILAGTGTVLAGLGKGVIGTAANFEKLRAQLKTATGSAEGAEKAFGFVREFAKNTPFQVEQVVGAFIKLTNLGLNPSERALTAYGDTASAMGKDLDQLIEAVADATTGEFERLKEFGIKSKSEGDKVSFTFRGVTTTVGKNASEIEEFLIGLSENNFAGAMAEQMETLNGIISNLQDAFSEFMLAIAEQGPLEEFKALVMDLRDASGDKEGLAKTLARVLVKAIRTLRGALKGDFIETLKTAAKTIEFVVDNFKLFIGLIAGAKTFQAFASLATGLRAMGFAASTALGPIGLIATAMMALIPIAGDVNRAMGEVFGGAQGKAPPVEPEEEMGAADFEGAGSLQSRAFALDKKISKARKRLSKRGADVGGLASKDLEKLQAQKRGLIRENERAKASATAQAAADAEAEGQRQRTAATELLAQGGGSLGQVRAARDTLGLTQGEEIASAEDAQFDRDLATARQRLNIREGAELTDRQQSVLDDVAVGLSEGKSLESSLSAADKTTRKRFGGGKKGKKKKKPAVTSATSISEFFAQASRGDLGPIAARTPSVKDIEPTVAIDITNNNFDFKVTQTISGVMDPKAAGAASVEAIKKEFDTRLAVAGQQMDSNLVR